MLLRMACSPSIAVMMFSSDRLNTRSAALWPQAGQKNTEPITA
jgi:hypothetical protein